MVEAGSGECDTPVVTYPSRPFFWPAGLGGSHRGRCGL